MKEQKGLPARVAKLRFIYHTNMLDICNVANQLGIITDEKAEEKMKNHCMKTLDCMCRMFGIQDEETLLQLLKNRKDKGGLISLFF